MQHKSKTRGKRCSVYEREYRSYTSMKSRCINPNNDRYSDYGGRGIGICHRWLESFDYFLDDMGTRPDGTSIDRIDVNGNYEPSNCRWATAKEQQNNNRRNRLLCINGETKTLKQWSEELNMPEGLIRSRIKLGWDDEKALKTPSKDFFTASKITLDIYTGIYYNSMRDACRAKGINIRNTIYAIRSQGYSNGLILV